MSEWILSAARQPTEADADEYGCVVVWHIYQGVMVLGWHQITEENPYLPYWMPAPGKPEGADKLRKRIEQDMEARRLARFRV